MSKTACPVCDAKQKSVVALQFHVRSEHPGAVKHIRPLLARLEREDRAAKKAEAAADAEGVLPIALRSLYEKGCPCGKSLAWHLRRAKTAASKKGYV